MSTTQDRIKVGLDLPTSDRTGLGWSQLRDIAMLAEEVGFGSIWLDDHLLYHMRGAAEPNGNWESWSILSALAACTRTVELGNLVLGMGFRNPALLAKMADTADEISGGRLILGVGTGYHEVEYNAFGYPYDHRYARFIAEERSTYRGEGISHVQVSIDRISTGAIERFAPALELVRKGAQGPQDNGRS